MRRYFKLLMLLVAMVTAAEVPARDLVVLATPQAPFKYYEDGQVKGIDAEVLSLVMADLGLGFKVRLIRSDSRIQLEAREGRADMLLLFSRKKERLEYLDYPEESYIDLTWHFFIRRQDQSRIRFERFQDLRGYQIGATRDVSYTPEFWQAGLNLQVISNNDLQIRKLMAGRIDAVALNTINTLYDAHQKGELDKITFLPKPLTSKPYFNVFPKASTHPEASRLRDEYDGIIRKLKREGKIKKIFDRYLGGDYARNLEQSF